MGGIKLVEAHWHHTADDAVLGRARAAVNGLLRSVDVDAECRERSVIAADELLSNVLEHAGTASVLSVSVVPACVRVAVTDGLPFGLAVMGKMASSTTGLALVCQVSRRLYVTPVTDGKSVVAEIDRR